MCVCVRCTEGERIQWKLKSKSAGRALKIWAGDESGSFFVAWAS